jgi:hypothetical protein
MSARDARRRRLHELALNRLEEALKRPGCPVCRDALAREVDGVAASFGAGAAAPQAGPANVCVRAAGRCAGRLIDGRDGAAVSARSR